MLASLRADRNSPCEICARVCVCVRTHANETAKLSDFVALVSESQGRRRVCGGIQCDSRFLCDESRWTKKKRGDKITETE
jgi:hypothetical protein